MITQEITVEAGITKVCTICKFDKNLMEFSVAKRSKFGRRPYCKKCDAQRYRNWYIENKERKNAHSRQHFKNNQEQYIKNVRRWKSENLNRAKAHAAVNRGIKKGSIVKPKECSKCNQIGPVEAHHDSYAPDKWLDVVFLCRSCHKRLHAENPHITQ